MSSARPLTAVTAALSTAVALLLLTPAASSAAGPGRHPGPGTPAVRATDRTSPREAARVDAVPTPRLTWRPCAEYECATAALPLDYDHPRGPTVEVALLKVTARDPARRIGSLFLNPGGPGGSGKGIAERATAFLSPEVLDRFDLIGVDPRGTNDSTRVECYADAQQQAADTDVLDTVFPVGSKQERAFGRAAARLATSCSTAGRPLAASMSTSEVARDMDVLRRAVGDEKLTYLGWSYGTYLGQVYANMFPDRVRAITIDGVVDPVAWRGEPATRDVPFTVRLDSAGGSSRALTTLLQRCRQAGAPRCPLMPDPQAAFDQVAAALRAEPLVLSDEDGSFELTYAVFVHEVLLTLYLPEAVEDVPAIVAQLQQLMAPQTTAAARSRASSRYSRLHEQVAQQWRRSAVPSQSGAGPTPLANDYELNAAVACSDSLEPRRPRRWAALADRVDRHAPYFGRFWLWTSATCARWTARDEDAYAGPFDRRTAAPVLVVGNYYDPATSYTSAVAVSRRLPGSRLLSSDSWGHTAYGTSGCATSAVDAYLLRLTLPARGTVCEGDLQPFAAAPADSGRSSR